MSLTPKCLKLQWINSVYYFSKLIQLISVYTASNIYFRNHKNPKYPSCNSNWGNLCLKTEILETGISDFHQRIVTSATIEFEKQPWQMFTYWHYKYYNNEQFEKDIHIKSLEFNLESIAYETFTNIFIDILHLNTSLKKECLSANHSKFISKELRK